MRETNESFATNRSGRTDLGECRFTVPECRPILDAESSRLAPQAQFFRGCRDATLEKSVSPRVHVLVVELFRDLPAIYGLHCRTAWPAVFASSRNGGL